MTGRLGNKTPLVDWMEGLLGPAKRGGSENVMFKCPFHSGGRHRGWSFTMHIYTGLCNCKSCGEGWSLYGLLKLLGAESQWGALKDAGLVLERDARLPPVARRRIPKELPEELIYLFPAAYGKLPFPNDIIDYFDVLWDEGRRRIIYPVRDHKGRIRAFHYRDVDAGDGGDRYRFYSKEDFAELNVLHDETGKEECFINGHNVFPKAWDDTYGHIIITEGPKQAMRVAEAGWLNVIALMGSMGNEQLRILCRFNTQMILFMDNDKPGKQAAWKYNGKLQYRGVSTHIVDYGDVEYRQPDEIPIETLVDLLRRNHAGKQQTLGPVQEEQEKAR